MRKLQLALLFILCHSFIGPAAAQEAGRRTATVTRTRHRAALAQDAVSRGTLVLAKPAYVCITTGDGQDMLLMEGNRFTMTTAGRTRTTTSDANPQFATFQKVLSRLVEGSEIYSLSSLPDVSVSRTGRSTSITITPTAGEAKARRRMMFSSFVLVLDSETAAFQRLRMEERDGSYTDYEFADFSTEPETGRP